MQDVELSQRDSFRFSQKPLFSETCEGVISDHCVNSTSEDEELSFECRQTTVDSVSDIGDEPLDAADASPSHFRDGNNEIEEEPEVFGGGLDSEIDIEQIEMH